ncbi:MAG: EamA family transporter, partial [Acidobacteriota bacterium]
LLVGTPLEAPGWQFYLFTLLTGVTGALGNGYLVKALRSGDLSVLGPINAWKAVVGLMTAYLLTGERPGWGGLPGIVLIIVGSYALLGVRGEGLRRGILRQPAIRYRILALLLTGVQAVFDKQVIRYSNLRLALVSWAVGGGVFALLWMRLQRVDLSSGLARLKGRDILWYLALAGSIGLMVVSTNYTFSRMPVGEALALFQLSILVSVVFGVRIFNEGDPGRKLIGALIMGAGSALILLID